MSREAFIQELASRIVGVASSHPVRVGIDGVDGVGKTCLADELVKPIQERGRPVIRASVDAFHNPSRMRYQRGRVSPEGYFRDSFNYEALTSLLLDPLGPEGSMEYRAAVFDYRTDTEVESPIEIAKADAILIFDGVFLHCRELVQYWDYSVFLDSPFEVTVARMAERGGGSPDVDAAENHRYVEGQKIYLDECEPRSKADVCVDNTDLHRPRIIRG
jgi:uridine kinase